MLQRIATSTRSRIAERKKLLPLDELIELAAQQAEPPSFIAALRKPAQQGKLGVIAECKARSPSAGIIRQDYQPQAIAAEYQNYGAHCISVLTEPDFFAGSDEHLSNVRRACDLPILRKDFTLDPYQAAEARLIGASAILVILALVESRTARALVSFASDMGLAALVETHSTQELHTAMQLREDYPHSVVIGINSRNLSTLETSLDHAISIAENTGNLGFCIAESGIRTHSDIACLQSAGFGAVLVGEHLLRQLRPGETLHELLQGS